MIDESDTDARVVDGTTYSSRIYVCSGCKYPCELHVVMSADETSPPPLHCEHEGAEWVLTKREPIK